MLRCIVDRLGLHGGGLGLWGVGLGVWDLGFRFVGDRFTIYG